MAVLQKEFAGLWFGFFFRASFDKKNKAESTAAAVAAFFASYAVCNAANGNEDIHKQTADIVRRLK